MLNKTDFVMYMGYFALVGCCDMLMLSCEQGHRPLGCSCELPCLCKVIWFVALWVICYMNKQLPLKNMIDGRASTVSAQRSSQVVIECYNYLARSRLGYESKLHAMNEYK
jgi:hypothetical protein